MSAGSSSLVVLAIAIGAWLAPGRVSHADVRQDFKPPDTDTWRRLGVLEFKPLFNIKNIGRDSNVFLDADTRDPQSDITATFAPSARGLVHFGDQGFLSFGGAADYVWFHQFGNLTHLNYSGFVRGNLNLRALRLFAAVDYQKKKERPNNEIDQRPVRSDAQERAGIGYEASSKTAIDLIVGTEQIRYRDPDFVFRPYGTRHRTPDRRCQHPDSKGGCPSFDLQDLLGRREVLTTLRLTHRAFGRTRLILDAEKRRHDFSSGVPEPDSHGRFPVVGSVRDADEHRALAGFEVEVGGTLWGEMRAGITNLRPDVLTRQATRSTVGKAEINWRLGSRLLMTTGFDRDINFSSYGSNLYYNEDHVELQCILYLNRVLGLEGAFDGYRLLYPVVGKPVAPLFDEKRQDEIRKIGGGLRFRLANKTAATLKVERRRRTSNIPGANDHQVVVTTGVETTF